MLSAQPAGDRSRLLGIESLRKIPLFHDFGLAELSEVATLLEARRYRKHAIIVREGEAGDSLFVILAGSVAVVRIGHDGRETILSILKERDFFGEMSIFDSAPRSATVRALNEVEVGAIEREDFLPLLDRNPKIGRLLVLALAGRLRAANRSISAAVSQDIRARVAGLLLDLAANFGQPVAGGTRIALRLTNQEMANMIGTTRETVNRILNRFWDDQIIDMRTWHVVVLDPKRLRAIAA
ncbi:MAG: Crp/Fnr family transcriptional regulator [Vulcanimicrobiaceae bacterium]